MNSILNSISSVCAASLIIGALYLICPDGPVSSSVKYALSLVFLLVVLLSVVPSVKNFDFNIDFSKTQTVTDAKLQIYNAEYVYKTALENSGIIFSDIKVCTDNSSDGSIIITKIIIYSADLPEKIMNVLKPVAENYEVEIINE